MIICTVGISKLIKVILSAFVCLFHTLSLNRFQKDINLPAADLIQNISQICKEFYEEYKSYFCKYYSPASTMNYFQHSENQDFRLDKVKNVCWCQTIFDESVIKVVFSSVHDSFSKSSMYLENNQLQKETSVVQPKIYSTATIHEQNLGLEDYENTTFQFQDSTVEKQVQNQDATEIICNLSESLVVSDELEERQPLKQLFHVKQSNTLQEFQLFEKNKMVCNNRLLEIWKDDQENIEFIPTQKSNPSLKAESLQLQSCFTQKCEDENQKELPSQVGIPSLKPPSNSIFSVLKNLQIYCFEVSGQSLLVPQNGFGYQNEEDIDMQVQQIDSFPIYDPSLMVDEIIDDDPQPFVAPIRKQIRKIYVFGHLIKFVWKQIKDQISFSV